MSTKLIHTLNDCVEVQFNDRPLFKYTYVPTYDPYEARKPFMHPIHTLAGNPVTIFRPHDHVWHKGIQMTMAVLSGQNFWGGPTFVRGKNYVNLDNIGRMQHMGWEELSCENDQVALVHRLKWITQAGQEWIDELRSIRLVDLNPEGGYWSLHWTLRLKNISAQTLKFGSPTTEGRENAGYGGLFWRGPRDFTGGNIIGAKDIEGPDSMGKRSPWLAFVGTHDTSKAQSTVLFVDRPGNPSYPIKWFTRSREFACIATSFSFDEEVPLEAGKELVLNYRTLFADGAWDRKRMDEYVSKL